MFLVESLLKNGLSACSISSMASSALDQDFLALAGKKSMREARQRLEFVMSFGVKAGECTGRLLLEEDSSVDDKSTVEPPTLCWLKSGLVAAHRSRSEQSAGSGVLQGGGSPCCDSSSSAGVELLGNVFGASIGFICSAKSGCNGDM